MSDSTTNCVVNNQARIFSDARRRLQTGGKLFAAERTHDEKAATFERFHRFAQGHAADDGAESHAGKPPSSKLQAPEKFQTPTSKRFTHAAESALDVWCFSGAWSLEFGA